MGTRSFAHDPLTSPGAMRLPVRFNIGNANAVFEVFLEAFQLVTITMQILPQSSASAVYSVSAQYEQAVSYLRIPNVDWWTLYWKLALVIAFIWLTSLVFIEVRNACSRCHAIPCCMLGAFRYFVTKLSPTEN